jgi:hypothetical protein
MQIITLLVCKRLIDARAGEFLLLYKRAFIPYYSKILVNSLFLDAYNTFTKCLTIFSSASHASALARCD